jgi:hypothetical protein
VRARFSIRKAADSGTRVAFFDAIVRRAVTPELPPPEPYTPPVISAVGAMSIQLPISSFLDSTTVFSKNPDTVLLPASLTKVISSVTALSIAKRLRLTLDYVLEMQAGDETAGSGSNLQVGDRFSFRDAIANMMLPSSNATAAVTANHFARSSGLISMWWPLAGEPVRPTMAVEHPHRRLRGNARPFLRSTLAILNLTVWLRRQP